MTSKNTSDELPEHLETAKRILSRISARWPIAEQVTGGGGTIPAVATLILPQAEWDALTKNEQVSLTFYTEKMVDDVRLNPTKYLTISTNAPIYPEMLDNFRHIRDGFWQIIVGPIRDKDAMTLMVDRSFVRGDEFWDSAQEKFGIRASIFREEGSTQEEGVSGSINLIPNSVNAVVDIRKLRDYCLNPEHAQGKHKARLFASTLGMTADDAEELRLILLDIVISHEAQPGRTDAFGQRYTIDFPLTWQDRSATIRSGWIIERGSEIPRLTTCYPL